MDERAELERLRKLKRLKELESRAAGSQTDVAPSDAPSEAWSGLMGFGQGGTLGFSDEMSGALSAGKYLNDTYNPVTRGLRSLFGSEDEASGAAGVGEAYKQGRDDYRATLNEAKATNPNAYLAGEVAGGIATPAPGGSAATFTGRLAQGALRGAAEGAVYGLGASDADLTEGEVGAAAQDFAVGGIAGGIGGAAGQGIGEGAQWLRQKAAKAVQSTADTQTIKALGAIQKDFKHLSPEDQAVLAEVVREYGIVTPFAGKETVQKRAASVGAAAGERLSAMRSAADAKGVMAKRAPLIRALEAEIEANLGKTGMQDQAYVRRLQERLDALMTLPEVMTPTALGAQKTSWQRDVNWNPSKGEVNAPVNRAAAYGSNVLRRAEDAAMDAAGMGPEFKRQKLIFGLMDDAEELAKAGVDRERGNNWLPLTATVVGAGALGAGATGPLAAAATLGTKAVKTYGPAMVGTAGNELAKGLASPAAASVVSAAGRTGGRQAALTENYVREMQASDWVRGQLARAPQSLGRYARSLQSAAQRGDADFAATMFTLQEQDPEFREMLRRRSD